ncbi:hypothetical protein ACJBXD_11190, partial [Streptococcus suis]
GERLVQLNTVTRTIVDELCLTESSSFPLPLYQQRLGYHQPSLFLVFIFFFKDFQGFKELVHMDFYILTCALDFHFDAAIR